MILAVVPARGGSKRLPGKNLRMLGGKTLLEWAIQSAWDATLVDRIVVSTDAREIECAAYSALFARTGPNPISAPPKPLDVILRPPHLAADTTPMIEVMQHALVEAGYPDTLVCVQPTTPFRTGALIDAVLRAMGEADSALTVYAERPTGEVYVTRRHLLLAGRLLGPRCVDYERPEPAINIDGEHDLVRAERVCERALIHGRPHDAKMAADHGVLSWPVRR